MKKGTWVTLAIIGGLWLWLSNKAKAQAAPTIPLQPTPLAGQISIGELRWSGGWLVTDIHNSSPSQCVVYCHLSVSANYSILPEWRERMYNLGPGETLVAPLRFTQQTPPNAWSLIVTLADVYTEEVYASKEFQGG